MHVELSSTRNPRVRAAAALARRRERRDRGLHLVEGRHPVREALAAGAVQEVFVEAALREDFEVPGVEVHVVADHVLRAIADATTPQGVVAVAATATVELAAVVGTGPLLVLDGLADPGNVGTTIRTADAVGAAAVVLTEGCADPFGPKAVRAAAGSTYHLPLVVGTALAEVVVACRAADQPTYGLDAGGTRSVFDVDDPRPLALVLGSEAHGLRDPALLDGTVAIPMAGRAESLNVAAAAAVAAFAVLRPRDADGTATGGPEG
ncbi:RNA methyltransferase [Nitriliruptoraceae bacterium ZYF776]|nr:RNA methyltransferase [Profundirhabdus halotolerans]